MAGFELNPLERAFLDASRELHEREEREARARVRRLRVLAVAASVFGVVALLVGGVAAVQWRNANDQKDRAEAATGEAQAQRNAAEAAAIEAILARLETEIPLLLKTNRSLAFLLAAQASDLTPGARTTSLMNRVLADDPRWLGSIRPSEGTLAQFAVSSDGKYVATTTQTGLLELRDAATHLTVASGRTIPAITTGSFLVFEPGPTLLHVVVSPSGESKANVIAVPSLEVVREFSWDSNKQGFAGLGGGSTVIALLDGSGTPGCCSLRLIDVRDGTERSVAIPPLDYVPSTFLFDPTGTFVAVLLGSRSIAVLDAHTFRLLTTIKPIGDTFAWSDFAGDGSVFLTAYTFGSLQLWDPRSGELLGTGKVNNFSPGAFTFGPSGRLIVVATDNQKISPLSLPNFAPLGVPFTVSSTGQVWSYFGADEKTFFSWSTPSNELEHWALDGRGLANAYSHAPGAGRAAVAPDGTWFVKQAADGSWARWKLPELTLLNSSASVHGATANNKFSVTAVSPIVSSDGRYIATAHTNCPAGNQARCSGNVVVWEASSGKQVGDPIPVPNPAAGGPGIVMAFHPGLPVVAIAGQGVIAGPDINIEIWGIAEGRLAVQSRFTVPADRPNLLEMVFVAPVGGSDLQLAMRPENTIVSLWDVSSSSPKEIARQTFGRLSNLAVTPAGAIVVADGDDLKFFEPKAFGESSPPAPSTTLAGALSPNAGAFARFSFSADGRRMALAQNAVAAGRISVWDLETKQSIGTSFNWLQSSTPGRSDDAFMAPDGSFVVSSSDGATVVWNLDTKLWAEEVCFAAGRNLTEAEWAKYFPGRDYAVTCERWPAKPRT